MMTKIKKWLIALLFGSAILAAPLAIPNNSFEKLDNVQKISDRYEVDFGEGSRVIIGGDGVDFKPHAKLGKWDDEVEINVWLETDKKIKPKQDKGKLKWKDEKKEIHFYTIGDDKFEFEIILNEKPDSNITELKIDSRGLKFYYQPELTQAEIDEGCVRPENVVGSYAVYHESKAGDYSKMGLKNYRAGKAFHIYRPKIIDSAGKEVWGELNITDNFLTVIIPQEFLDNAVYPVRHAAGLTFGDITEGGTVQVVPDRITGSYFMGAVGTADSISSYGFSPGTFLHRYAIYKQSDSSKVDQTDSGAGDGTTDWHTLSFSSPPAITAQNYYLFAWCDDDFLDNTMFYDSTGNGGYQAYDWDNASSNYPASVSLTGEDRIYSIYCTYSADEEEERRIIKIE